MDLEGLRLVLDEPSMKNLEICEVQESSSNKNKKNNREGTLLGFI